MRSRWQHRVWAGLGREVGRGRWRSAPARPALGPGRPTCGATCPARGERAGCATARAQAQRGRRASVPQSRSRAASGCAAARAGRERGRGGAGGPRTGVGDGDDGPVVDAGPPRCSPSRGHHRLREAHEIREPCQRGPMTSRGAEDVHGCFCSISSRVIRMRVVLGHHQELICAQDRGARRGAWHELGGGPCVRWYARPGNERCGEPPVSAGRAV